jgi:hypothetical protein
LVEREVMTSPVQLRLVPRLELPRVKDTTRPFRIWDSVERRAVRWRCYAIERNAHNSALALCRWESVGRTLEVVDIRTGRWLATYRRGLGSIEISALKERNA